MSFSSSVFRDFDRDVGLQSVLKPIDYDAFLPGTRKTEYYFSVHFSTYSHTYYPKQWPYEPLLSCDNGDRTVQHVLDVLVHPLLLVDLEPFDFNHVGIVYLRGNYNGNRTRGRKPTNP
jgi:hypothetical protein